MLFREDDENENGEQVDGSGDYGAVAGHLGDHYGGGVVMNTPTHPGFRRPNLRTYLLTCAQGYLCVDGRRITARPNLALRFEELNDARQWLRTARVPAGDWRITILEIEVTS